jgi:hypothetical protein
VTVKKRWEDGSHQEIVSTRALHRAVQDAFVTIINDAVSRFCETFVTINKCWEEGQEIAPTQQECC